MTRNNAIVQLSPTTVGKDSKQDDTICPREGDTCVMQRLIEKTETECRTRGTERARNRPSQPVSVVSESRMELFEGCERMVAVAGTQCPGWASESANAGQTRIFETAPKF